MSFSSLVCDEKGCLQIRRCSYSGEYSNLVALHEITLISFLKALSHCPRCGSDLNVREAANSEDPLVAADTPSPSPPSPPTAPSTSPLKKLVTTRPALTKTGRLIGTFSISHLSIPMLTLSSQLGSKETVTIARFLQMLTMTLRLLETEGSIVKEGQDSNCKT